MNRTGFYHLIVLLTITLLTACSAHSARVTPEEKPPTQMPTKRVAVATSMPQETAPPPGGLQIVKEVLTQCRSQDPGGVFWGAWEVRVNSSSYWVKRGKGEVVVEGPGEVELDRIPILFNLAVDEVGWITPLALISGKGSKINRIYLRPLDPIPWVPIDPSSSKYDWESTFVSHMIDEGDYPTHELKVQIANNSDFAMEDVVLFALIYDTSGSLVDAVSNRNTAIMGAPTIRYGEKGVLVAKSILPQMCIGKRDPNGYSADYWIDFKTVSGQLVTRYFRVERTSEAELVSVQLSDPAETTDGIRVGYIINNRDDRSHIVQLQVIVSADWTCPSATSRQVAHEGLASVEVASGGVVKGHVLVNDRDSTRYGGPAYFNMKRNQCILSKLGIPKQKWSVLSEEQEIAVRAVQIVDFTKEGPFEQGWGLTNVPIRISNNDPRSTHWVGVECLCEDKEKSGSLFVTRTESISPMEIPPNSSLDRSMYFTSYRIGRVLSCEIVAVDGISYRKGEQ